MEKRDTNWKLKKIVQFIRENNLPNADDLVEKFRVEENFKISRISIYRHIRYLKEELHAPIETDMTKPGCGYYLTDKNFWSDKLVLTSGELVGLGLLQSLMKVYKNTPVEKELSSFMQKIQEFLPDGARYKDSAIAEYIKVITDPMAVIDTSIFTEVIESVQQHRTIRFLYSKSGSTEPKSYTVNPYRIIFCQNGDWYLMACKNSDRSAIRTFAFSRMSSIESTGERFTIPQEFRLESYIDPEMGVWHSESLYKVKLLFDRQLGQHAKERKWHHTQHIVEYEDGRVQVELTTSQLKDIARIVLGYGSLVQVLEPTELIEDLKAELEKMTEFYG